VLFYEFKHYILWFLWAYLSDMKATTAAPRTPVNTSARKREGQARSGLPPGFNVAAWTRQACERSGVPVGVSDPVTLAKLRVLTRPEH